MSLKRISETDNVFTRRYEYDDEAVVAADLGVSGEATVDVLGDVAIVVFENEDGSEQVELELPDGEAEAFITNGVLTVEVGL
jgi:hypothetical protein